MTIGSTIPDFEVSELLTATSFTEIVDGSTDRAFLLGIMRDILQVPFRTVITARGDEGIALVKSFDAAMIAARPYVDKMSEIADNFVESKADERFELLDVVNAIVDGIEYEKPEDKFVVAFITGMWASNIAKNDEEDEDEDFDEDEEEDFVEDPSADA